MVENVAYIIIYGTGNPNGVTKAPRGHIFVDLGPPRKAWINNSPDPDGFGTTWAQLSEFPSGGSGAGAILSFGGNDTPL